MSGLGPRGQRRRLRLRSVRSRPAGARGLRTALGRARQAQASASGRYRPPGPDPSANGPRRGLPPPPHDSAKPRTGPARPPPFRAPAGWRAGGRARPGLSPSCRDILVQTVAARPLPGSGCTQSPRGGPGAARTDRAARPRSGRRRRAGGRPASGSGGSGSGGSGVPAGRGGGVGSAAATAAAAGAALAPPRRRGGGGGGGGRREGGGGGEEEEGSGPGRAGPRSAARLLQEAGPTPQLRAARSLSRRPSP